MFRLAVIRKRPGRTRRCQRSNALSCADTPRVECVGQLFRTRVQLAISRSMDVAFDAARHDLHRAVMAVGVLNQR